MAWPIGMSALTKKMWLLILIDQSRIPGSDRSAKPSTLLQTLLTQAYRYFGVAVGTSSNRETFSGANNT
jgi:hypothetical protein